MNINFHRLLFSQVTPAPRPGEKRLVQSFDVRLSTLYEATIDILFTKNKASASKEKNSISLFSLLLSSLFLSLVQFFLI